MCYWYNIHIRYSYLKIPLTKPQSLSLYLKFYRLILRKAKSRASILHYKYTYGYKYLEPEHLDDYYEFKNQWEYLAPVRIPLYKKLITYLETKQEILRQKNLLITSKSLNNNSVSQHNVIKPFLLVRRRWPENTTENYSSFLLYKPKLNYMIVTDYTHFKQLRKKTRW